MQRQSRANQRLRVILALHQDQVLPVDQAYREDQVVQLVARLH